MVIDEEEFREHLNMTQDEAQAHGFALLGRLLAAAISHTEAQLGYRLDDVIVLPKGLPDDIKLAVLMLAAHWFAQRESVVFGVTGQPIPHGYDDVIRSHRSYTFG